MTHLDHLKPHLRSKSATRGHLRQLALGHLAALALVGFGIQSFEHTAHAHTLLDAHTVAHTVDHTDVLAIEHT